MIYYFERTKVAGDESYVTIYIQEDGKPEKTFIFDKSTEFSREEKDKLSAVVPVNGFVSSTIDYDVRNLTYGSMAIRVLVRREER